MSGLTKLAGAINKIWTLGLAGGQFSLNGSAATANRVFTLPDADCAVHKNNLSATTDPGVGDDVNDVYSVGSVWINATTEAAFICVDNSVGAAVWIKTGPSTKIVKFDFLEGTTNNPLTSATSSGTTLQNMTKTFTPEKSTNWCIGFFTGQFENDDKKNERGAYAGFNLDGTLQAKTERGISVTHDDPDFPGHISTQFSQQLSVAPHTLKVDFWGDADDTIGKDMQRSLLFLEIEL